jgi:cbb3-type cytochrome oxidase maturation protein
MDVVILLVFISLTLVVAGLLFFFYRLKAGDFEHGDRLALTPLADDEPGAPEPSADGSSEPPRASKGPEGGEPHVEP